MKTEPLVNPPVVGPNKGAKALKEWMGVGGWTVQQVASHIGCSSSAVRCWTSCRAVPGIAHAYRLKSLCRIDPIDWICPT